MTTRRSFAAKTTHSIRAVDIRETDVRASHIGSEGEDLVEALDTDYRAIPELDNYDERDLDHRTHDELDFQAPLPHPAAPPAFPETRRDRLAMPFT